MTAAGTLKANDLLAFVPAQRRYNEAIEFYQEIGFEIDYRADSISVVRKDNCKFFLQNVNYEYADGNFMMTLEVDDVDAWWQHLSSLNLEEKYPGVKLRAPEDFPWGMREIHLIDPCGVLWHIAVRI